MGIKRWTFHPQPERRQEIAARTGLPDLVADILASRQLDDGQIDMLLGEGGLESPLALKDMDRAVERLNLALEEQQSIAIYADYDCDGITSAVALYTYLNSIGAVVSCYIPEREQGGYGLNQAAIDQLAQQGVDLIVTVDNGISAVDEADYIASLGIDLVITDHHLTGDRLPKAVAVVDPQRPDCPSQFKALAGVGVVFKLITAMEGGDYDTVFSLLGDFVAIGTIGDVVPLEGENRTLVQHGLPLIEYSDNLGLHALLEAAGLQPHGLSARSVAFGLVPRINAAGRFNCANDAFRLFTAEDPQEAARLAEQINRQNAERQQLEQQVQADIFEEIAHNPHKLCNRVLVFAKAGWPAGLIGIACARIVERFGKPAVLFAVDGEFAVGSARSVEGFSMFEAVESVQALCTKWGGHALAAGMTVAADQLEAFDLQINQYAQTQYPQMPEKRYAIDHQLALGELTVEQIRMLDRLEPYGSSNPEPIFLLRRAVLAQIAPLSGGKHLRLGFQLQDGTLQALYFGVSPDRFHYRPGAALDLLVHLSINHWNGNDSVSVQIVDLRPTQLEQDKFFRAKQVYEKIMRKEPVGATAARQAVPSRKEFAAVYRLLRKMGRFTGSAETLYCLLSNQINFCKLSIILEVLQEKGLVQSDGSGDEIVVCAQPPRVDILDAPLLHSLQQEIGE